MQNSQFLDKATGNWLFVVRTKGALFIFRAYNIPDYLSYYMMLLISFYFLLFLYSIVKFKFDKMGIALLIASFFTFIMVLLYTTANGYFVDAYPEHMRAVPLIGFMELIFLPYPYIFLILSMVYGRKKRAN